MRVSTGLFLIGVSLVFAFTLLAPRGLLLARLILVVPLYGGVLSALEGLMSFCVFHASRGTYDFSERMGIFLGNSESRKKVESEEWRKQDRRKAGLMHLEAITLAVVAVSILLVV